jgi:hypothetical protein
MIANRCWGHVFETTTPKPVYSSPCSKSGSPLDVRTALEVQKEQETTDQIMNKLFENKKFRNAVEHALRVLK